MSGDFWPWWLGAIGVGAVATSYPLVSGRLLGVSSLYASLVEKKAPPAPPLSELERALLAETEAEFGPSATPMESSKLEDRVARGRVEAERFRPLFLAGMVLGPLLAAAFAGELRASFTLGQSFDSRYGGGGVLPVAVLVLSGILIGFGTRLAGGCTSGHGISGLARGQAGSILTTFVFWGTALAVTWLFVSLRGR
jgi:uncharacterized membrane protein YedE/YeeE